MINKIRVLALKSIKDLNVECSNLNLLVGTNSSGKTTLLHALLLLAQRGLNGKYISIGDFREVRNYYMSNSPIRIEILEKGKRKPAWIEFDEDKENETYNIHTSLEELTVADVMMDEEHEDIEQSTLIMEE